MFYDKQKLGQSLEMKVDIQDKNASIRCHYRRVEIVVDLMKVLLDKEGDLHSAAVVCIACIKKGRG